MSDLQKVQYKTIAPVTGILPQPSHGDVQLPHRAEKFADTALQEVIVSNLIMEMCQLRHTDIQMASPLPST
jgi:hypothetical protein